MTIWQHIRLAGAVAIIIAAFINNIMLTFIGLMIQFVGVIGSVSNLEQRVTALESKGANDEEA